MVYKKYIEKNGKLYGPYIYHSRRVNGKVISEYHGMKKDIKWNKFVFLILGVFILIFLIYTFFNFKGGITGNVALNLPNADSENAGKLSMSVSEGELIPSSSKVIFESESKIYEYALSSLVQEEIISGDYYIEGNSLSGSGEGYGVKGEKLNYPRIYFTLLSSQEVQQDENPPETPEQTGEIPINNSENIEEPPAETNPEENIPAEEQPQTETPITEEQPVSEQTTSEEQPSETTEITTSQPQLSEEPINSETPAAESSSESQTSSAPITGGIISRIFSTVSHFFLGIIKSTGFAVSTPIESEISGEADANEPFVYIFKQGENIKLVSGSVRTDSKNLDDNAIKMSFEGDKLLIETDYSESEQGFGESYLGNEQKIIYISIPEEINLAENKKIKISYNDQDLILIDQISELNETVILEENITINISDFNIQLTEEEKKILEENFGNLSIQPIKSELFNGRYIMGYSLGDYKIEYSYDSDISTEKLISQIENDRIKWLKDIVNRILQSEGTHEEVNLSISNILQ